jgi:antitoxin HigA-1
MSNDRLRPVRSGEVLREDLLAPPGLSVNAPSVAMGVSSIRVREVVKARWAVTAETATLPARYFGGDAASWLPLQAKYDLKTLPTMRSIQRDARSREQLVA